MTTPFLSDDWYLSRRSLFGSALAAGAGLGLSNDATAAETPPVSPLAERYRGMKKSINLWAFPYPQKMTLE